MPEPIPEPIRVEVCRVDGDRVACVPLVLPAGATVADALVVAHREGLIPDAAPSVAGGVAAAELDGAAAGRGPGVVAPAGMGLAIYGRAVSPSEPLANGDRLELLPPLRVDPKVARARRAERARRLAGNDKWRGAGR